MKKSAAFFVFLMFSFLCVNIVSAEGLPWRDHRTPFDFLFGNNFDNHQQSKIGPKGDLFGFLYITFTGEYSEEGYPIAEHANCNEVEECTVGWRFRGVPGAAVFVYHEAGNHPLWLVERGQIPQPGAFSHFHWLDGPENAGGLEPGETYGGYFLEIFALDTFVFRFGDREIPVRPGIDTATHLNMVLSFPSQ